MVKQRLLPVLDIARYHTHRSAFIDDLRYVCHTVGAFLIRHDLPNDLGENMLQETRQFFARPLDEKMQIFYGNSQSFRGYMPLGVENTSGRMDAREQVEYAAEYPFMESTAHKAWPLYERLKSKTNPWPHWFQPSLKDTTLEFASHVSRIADCIRDSLSVALLGRNGTGPHQLACKFQEDPANNELPHWVVKLVSYPPKETLDADTEHQGVGPHTDTNFLTLLLQDQVGGLQVYSQGHWVDVPTIHGSSVLICNLGEQAETWSRGYFLATPHRVQQRRQTTTPRTSVPFFYNPNLSATMEPVDSMCIQAKWERPSSYIPWRRKENSMLTNVGDNTFKSLARSHPNVFAQHHPDLQILPDGRIVPA